MSFSVLLPTEAAAGDMVPPVVSLLSRARV